ncbi:hypothetical protein CL673_05610, partial [Candidatus Bathyarchaeota archaeon]|nr:hypothetical protein [Candidatus Bathyarchaeota archaeon]
MKTDLKKLAERKKVVAGEPSDPAEAFPQHPYNRTNLFRCILPDSDDTRWVETSPEKAGQKDVLLYLGCYIMITPHLIATAREILKATGLSFEVVGGTRNCCGAPYLRAGNFEAAEEYDKRRLKLFEAYQPKDVATACTACYQYTQHFTVPTQNPAFSFKTIHKFLAENLDRLRFTRRVDAKVALHEHFGRYGEETDENYEASRRVLSRIPGI